MRLVILGLPPTTNNLYAIVSGRQVKVEVGRVWTKIAAAVARAAWAGREPSHAPFAVLITYHLGAYERDVDGSHKAIIDGFAPKGDDGHQEPIIWYDDRQLILFAARKVRAPKGTLPYVSVVVRELGEIPPPYREPRAVQGALGFETSIMPPSANNTYTVWRGQRRKSKEAREVFATYRVGFAELVAADTDPTRFPFSDSVRVRVRYGYIADRRDVDGSHKLLFDAARGEGGGGLIWRDDLQITSLAIAKGRVATGDSPRIAGDVRDLAEAA